MTKSKVLIPILVAAILWFLMFSVWTAHWFNFWVGIAISALILMLIAFVLKRDMVKSFRLNWSGVVIGLSSAVLLWGIFFVGDYLAAKLFDFASNQVDSIYAMKAGNSKLWIGLGLLFVMGPAEEIFWRGFVQHSLMERFGEWRGFIFATLVYALIHIWSFNFMLVMAALVCGIFWGSLYKKTKNLVPLIISHAVWDVAVFIVWPI